MAVACIVSLTLASSSCAFGQPTKVSSRNYGRQSSDPGGAVKATFDGGFVLTGYAEADFYLDNPMSKVLVSEFAGNGTEEWRKVFDGKSGSGRNEGQALLQTREGGFIIAGYTTTYGDSNGDALVIEDGS